MSVYTESNGICTRIEYIYKSMSIGACVCVNASTPFVCAFVVCTQAGPLQVRVSSFTSVLSFACENLFHTCRHFPKASSSTEYQEVLKRTDSPFKPGL